MLLQILPSINEWFASTGTPILIGLMLVILGVIPILGLIVGSFISIFYIDSIIFNTPSMDFGYALAGLIGVIGYFVLLVALIFWEKRDMEGYAERATIQVGIGFLGALFPYSLSFVLLLYFFMGVFGVILAVIIVGTINVLLILESRDAQLCIKVRGKERCIGGQP